MVLEIDSPMTALKLRPKHQASKGSGDLSSDPVESADYENQPICR